MKEFNQQTQALCILMLLSFSICTAQNSSFNLIEVNSNYLNLDFQESRRDSLIQWQERVVLHIANEQTEKDKLVFFKGYLISGLSQNRYSPSKVLHVELIDVAGEVIKKQSHKILDGMVVGSLELPKKVARGNYYVRAYTRWMQNYGADFYAKEEVWIGESADNPNKAGSKVDVGMFPEGGTILNGYENRVVFKMEHTTANNAVEFGKILDDKNNQVARVSKYSKTIGTAIYTPIKDREYRLALADGTTFPMPKAQDNGFLLRVNNQDASEVKIEVTASSSLAKTAVKLIGVSGGIRYFEEPLNFKASPIAEIKFSKESIPHGVLMLAIINQEGVTLAQRPIWIAAEELYVAIDAVGSDTGGSSYRIKVTDKNNAPVKTTLALSANRELGFVDKPVELHTIHQPMVFRYPEVDDMSKDLMDRKKRFLNDLNVLVSDFGLDSRHLDELSFDKDIKFPIQRGLEFTGYAYDLDNKLLVNTTIQIMSKSSNETLVAEKKTDATGLLRLDEMQINGNATLVFRTAGNNTTSRLVKLQPVSYENEEKHFSSTNSSKTQQLNRIDELTFGQPMNADKLIELDEVQVSENKKRNASPSVYGIDVSALRTKYQDLKKPRSLAIMLSEMPGVAVAGIGDFYPSVRINRAVGGGPILFVLDGVPLSQGMDGQGLSRGSAVGNSLRPIMDMVSDNDIERVELLVGAEAAIYGVRAAGGVILIYTVSGASENVRRKDGQLVMRGYEPIFEFETYLKDRSKREIEKSNLLYWNPWLETDENGEVVIEIPASSQIDKMIIEASIITTDGKIGSLHVLF